MSPISYGDIRDNLTARKLIRALERDGFQLERSKGSHHHYKHPDGRRVTVTYPTTDPVTHSPPKP